MGSNTYFEIPNDVVVAIVGSDQAQCLVMRKTLQNLGLKAFKNFERCAELLESLASGAIDMIYLVGRPSDMDSLTLIRSARSGKVAAITPIAMVLAPTATLAPEEKTFLQDYHVALVTGAITDEKTVSASLREVFAKRFDPTSIQSRLHEAKAAFSQGLKDTAASIYREVLAESQSDIVARVGLARATADTPEVHFEQLQKLIEQDPKNYHFKFDLIERLLQLGRTAKAMKVLDEVAQELAAFKEVFWLNELGILCVRLKLFAFALKVATRLKTLVTADRAWLPDMLLSRIALASGDDGEAAKFLQIAETSCKSKQPEIENMRAVLARRLGKYDAAIVSYRKALALSPEDHRVAYNIGVCYEKMGNPIEAIKYFKIAVKISPHFKKALERCEASQQSEK